jgi:hypothetical protein
MTNVSELIFVGIDVSKASLEVALDDHGKTRPLSNSEAGIKALLALLEAERTRIAVVLLEATGGLDGEHSCSPAGGLPYTHICRSPEIAQKSGAPRSSPLRYAQWGGGPLA